MDHRRIWMRSLAITLIWWIIYYIVGMLMGAFKHACSAGSTCQTAGELFLSQSRILLPTVFILVLGGSYLLAKIKGRAEAH